MFHSFVPAWSSRCDESRKRKPASEPRSASQVSACILTEKDERHEELNVLGMTSFGTD